MRKAIEKCSRAGVFALLIIWLLTPTTGLGEAQEFAAAELTPFRQRLQTRITYSCTELGIEKVLMELAGMAGIDIVKSPKVTGNVTVKLTEVPLEEALGNILAAHDYTYVATESMVRVMPLSEVAAAREELVTRIYQVKYADSNDVARALKNFVSQRGKVALNRGTSHIMVTDTEGQIKGIDRFIEQIDHITPQVLVEVRIYDITSNEGFKLDLDWFAGNNSPLEADAIVLPDEIRTTEVGRTDFWEERVDERVGIERGDPDNFTDTRSEHSWTKGGTETDTRFINPPAILTNFERDPFVGGSFDRETGGTLRFSVLNDAVDIEFALSVLHKQVEAKLLANPRVLVLDNETANFEIVREIPYRELLQVAREDPITYTEFKDVGVQLKVRPHIARDGMIRLHIEPEFGVLVGLDPNGVPTVDTRRADTVAMIKNGQTIVMGGLRKREITKDISKVPILGDMPLLGGLFQSETESVNINELVVFITTKIITEPALTETEQRQLKETQFTMPRISKTRLELGRQAKAEAEPKPEVPEVTELLDLLLKEEQ
ncbi:MAG: secretin N-terminal domain-containing protein [Planctomycetota bacterium]